MDHHSCRRQFFHPAGPGSLTPQVKRPHIGGSVARLLVLRQSWRHQATGSGSEEVLRSSLFFLLLKHASRTSRPCVYCTCAIRTPMPTKAFVKVFIETRLEG